MKNKILLIPAVLFVLAGSVLFLRHTEYVNFLNLQNDIMQQKMEIAVKDLFISDKKIYPSINMYFKYSGNSGLFLNARHANNRNNFKEAGDFFVLLADKADVSPAILREAYISLSLAGRISEAGKYSDMALEKGANDFLTIVISLANAIKEQDYQKAQTILKKQKEKGYNRNFVSLLSAWVATGETDFPKAFKILDKLKSSPSFQAPLEFHTALIYDIAGKTDDAALLYEKILGKNGEKASIRSLQLAISFYRRSGNEKRAKELLEYYKQNPAAFANLGEDFFYPANDTAPINNAKQGIAEALLGVATNYTKGEDVSVGILFLRVVLDLDGNLIPAKILLAEVFEKQEMYEEAIALYDSLPKGDFLYFASQTSKIELLTLLERYDEALASLQQLKEAYDKKYELFIVQGDIYKAQNNYKAAAEAYSDAINQVANPDAVPPSLYAMKGMMLGEINQWDEAEKNLLTALSKAPSDSMTLNYLGYSWLTMNKNLSQAQQMIALAVENSKNDAYIVDSFGWSFYMLGDYPMAIKILEKSLEQLPSNSIINDHLGDAYWKSGRKREALFQWIKAVKFNNEIKPQELLDIEFKIEHGLDALEEKKAKLKEKDKDEESKKEQSKILQGNNK